MNKIAFTAPLAKLVVGLTLVLSLVLGAYAGNQPTSTFEPSAPLDATQARVELPLHDQRTLQCYWINDDPAAGVDCVEAGSLDAEDDE